ncbi:hypothetical protein B7R54_17630 [Subtercola boreus]|uniref:Abi-like protein n=1 Tax=Subtercola boreus TaxID=120213 RepID=A0A3E0VLF9_9MICO|nr:hypothetical protein [Subtercola boreus]RFA10824.1 hypothetical protein B7R54_17630 [Subtercola boreus]TQL55598.1 hypothetical protein FB464_3167 [Subtercola boreus]
MKTAGLQVVDNRKQILSSPQCYLREHHISISSEPRAMRSDSDLYRLLSAARMRPYLTETGDHRKNALALYRWNMAIAGAFYQGLHVFEIALRNSVDVQLRIWNATQSDNGGHRFDSEWCKRPSDLLVRLIGGDLGAARERAAVALKATGKSRNINHDDIVAQTSLGTWRFLLPSRTDPGKAVLWQNCTRHAFPNLVRPVGQLVDAVESVYRLRNRIAHLEPVFAVNLEAKWKNMHTVLEDIDMSTAEWFVSTSPIPNILARRPVTA